MNDELSSLKSAMLGHAVADAMGVPVEFESRETLKKDPVTGYRGYGSHSVPPVPPQTKYLTWAFPQSKPCAGLNGAQRLWNAAARGSMTMATVLSCGSSRRCSTANIG